MELKTLFVITLATARMVFPGVPAGDNLPSSGEVMVPAARTITMDLWSNEIARDNSRVEVSLPAGLKITGPASMEIDNSIFKQASDSQVQLPDITVKDFWGCGEAIPDGQPKITKAKDSADILPFGSLPKKTYAYWPSREDSTVPQNGSAVGSYNLTTDFAGNTAVEIAKEHDFLAALDLKGIDNNVDLNKPIKIEWKSIPNAQGYVVSAFGGSTEQSINWTSGSDPKAPSKIEYEPLTDEKTKKMIEDKLLLPPDATSCVIPAGVFKEATGAMLTLTAVGKDKVIEKDGITTYILVRSTVSAPLHLTPPTKK